MTILSDKDRDPDFVGAEQAMRRAARRAREIAYQTGTPIAIYKDGAVVKREVTPSDLADN